MTSYTTQQGDTWDIISKRLYGDEHYFDVLIKANIDYRKIVVFPYGIVLNVPDIDTASTEYDANMPPWKRTGGD
jgi:nucleoid-associated protein YgaU